MEINGVKVTKVENTPYGFEAYDAFSLDGVNRIRVFKRIGRADWSYARYRWDDRLKDWGIYLEWPAANPSYYEVTDAFQAARSKFERIEF